MHEARDDDLAIDEQPARAEKRENEAAALSHMLRDAIRTRRFRPEHLRWAMALTDREREVLTWVRLGKTNPEIAAILDIKTATVKTHMERLLRKKGVINRMML